MWEGLEYNEDNLYRDIFLHSLSNAIIDERVKDVPPAIMQQLVLHLADMQLWKVTILGSSLRANNLLKNYQGIFDICFI